MAYRPDLVTSPPARAGRWGVPLLPFLAGLAGVELAWLVWFLTALLPNTWNTGWKQALTRGMLLWRALPEVVPGVRWHESHLGMALQELSHVENLPQRVPLVLAAALIAGAALALGQLVLRALRLHGALSRGERLPLEFGLGALALSLATLGCGRLGLLRPWPVRITLMALGALGLALAARGWKPWIRRGGSRAQAKTKAAGARAGAKEEPPSSEARSWTPRLGLLLITGPFVLVMALGAMLPTYDYDAIEYHLEGPKEYFLAGRITFLEHNVYTSMPFGVEMLHLLGMEVVGDWWWGALVGQLLVACFAPAAGALIYVVARRLASERAAWVAAVVYLTTPWVYRLANFPYVEGPLCFFHAALLWAALRAWTAEHADRARFWAVIGLLAGGAMSCKYTALVTAVVPFGLLALSDTVRRRSASVVLAFTIGVALTVGPWLIKNLIDTGNPVYPLAYHVFGGRFWDAAREAKWAAAHGPRPVSATILWGNIVDVAGRSDWQSPLYTALAPLALLRRGSRRSALVLWGYVVYLFATWWLLTHRLDRFWLPLLPAAAVLAGLGADWVRSRAWTALLAVILAVGIVANGVFVSTALAGFNQWTGNLLSLRDRVPLELNPALAQLDADLPPGARVLLVGQAAVFHMQHAVVYNTVFNVEILESLARDRDPAQTQRDLERMGVDFVYVDWNEIARFRSPGNYGFTAFITPALFDRLVRAGVLEPVGRLGLQQELYRVKKGGPSSTLSKIPDVK